MNPKRPLNFKIEKHIVGKVNAFTPKLLKLNVKCFEKSEKKILSSQELNDSESTYRNVRPYNSEYVAAEF